MFHYIIRDPESQRTNASPAKEDAKQAVQEQSFLVPPDSFDFLIQNNFRSDNWRFRAGLQAVASDRSRQRNGAILQGITRNDLADPGIIGINSEAGGALLTAALIYGFSYSRATSWFFA